MVYELQLVVSDTERALVNQARMEAEKHEPGADREQQLPVFVLNLVTIDWYMTAPIPGLDVEYSRLVQPHERLDLVPVLRVFGPNGSGQKTCAHLHGVGSWYNKLMRFCSRCNGIASLLLQPCSQSYINFLPLGASVPLHTVSWTPGCGRLYVVHGSLLQR